MSKELTVEIMGKFCEDCKFATVLDDDKRKIIVHCGARDKNYYWGQCIPCNDKVKI